MTEAEALSARRASLWLFEQGDDAGEVVPDAVGSDPAERFIGRQPLVAVVLGVWDDLSAAWGFRPVDEPVGSPALGDVEGQGEARLLGKLALGTNNDWLTGQPRA